MFGQASPVAHLQCQQLKMCHTKIAEKSFKSCILYIVLYLESLWKATSPFMWNWYKRRPEKELEAANKGPEIIVPLDVLPRVKCQATKNLQLGGESKNSWSAFVFLCRQPDPVRLSLGGQNRLGVVLSGLHYSTDSSYLVLSVVLDDKYQWEIWKITSGISAMLSLLTCKSQKTALMSRTIDSPKEKTEAGEECFEIVVSVVFCVRVKIETTKHLRGLSCTSHTYLHGHHGSSGTI